MTEVLGESTARVATGNARSGTEQQRYESDDDEDPGRGQDLGDRCAVFDDVDEVGSHKGDRHLAGDLEQHQDWRGDCGPLVVSNGCSKRINHLTPPRSHGSSRAFRRVVLALRR